VVFIWIYRLIFIPIVLLASPKLLLKMKRRGGYQEAFASRFGFGWKLDKKDPDKRRIWIQAVSLGEMLAIEGLLKALAKDDRIEIVLTTTTSTGFAEAKKRYLDICYAIKYFPTDFWLISRAVWRRVEPDLAVCVETELWPEHLRQAKKRNVPVVVVNGRLSNRSFKRSKSIAPLFKNELNSIRMILAGSDQDRARFVELGVDSNRVKSIGNMKTDIDIQPLLDGVERASLKNELGFGIRFVLLGSSTWPGEEEMLVKAFRKLRGRMAESSLLIVPRHAERRGEIRSVLADSASDFKTHFRSEGESPNDLDILVADTHGELRLFTQIADLAFVGKSLPPHTEGQTPIECGLLAIPTVMGPGMHNFPGVADQLRECGAAEGVKDEAEAIDRLVELALDESTRLKMQAGSRGWARENRGSIDRTVNELVRLIL